MEDQHTDFVTVRMRYKLRPEQLSDRWVVKSEQFKSFAYGDTPEEAKASFKKAVEMAVSRFDDLDELSNFLNATGIHWWLESPEPEVLFQDQGVALAGAGFGNR